MDNPYLKKFFCRHFQVNGVCKFNNKCVFSHSQTAIPIPWNVCVFFLKKICTKQQCSYLHVSALELNAQVGLFSHYNSSCYQNENAPSTSRMTDSGRFKNSVNDSAFRKGNQKFFDQLKVKKNEAEEKTCGICMDNITGEKKFGLLNNCNHMFCFPCIMKWRKTKNLSEESTKSCPECRKKSDHVIPSSYFVVGEKKVKVFEKYKSYCRQRICKFERDGVNYCRFRDSCFYKHTLPFKHVHTRHQNSFSYTISNSNFILNTFFSDSSDDDIQIFLADASFL